MYEATINVESAVEMVGINITSSLNPDEILQITELNNYVMIAFIILGVILVGYFLYQLKKGPKISA